MRRNRIQLLALVLATVLAGCASGAQPAASQAGQARGTAGTEEACRTYSPPNMTGVSPPKLLHGDQPDASQLSSKSGYACVRVTISTSGSVTETQVVQTDNDEFARAFVRALAD